MPRKIEPYRDPKVSVLEAHREEIAEMARQNWPLTKILEYLKSEYKIRVAYSRIWMFCRTRNIVKGRGEVAAPKKQETKAAREHGGRKQATPAADHEPDMLSDLLPPEEPGNPFTKFKPKQ